MGNIFEELSDFLNNISMGNEINYRQTQLNPNSIKHKHGIRKIQDKGIMGIAIPKLSQLYILRFERATLIDSSTILFGNECMRLVNIVFQTSQMFPTVMGRYEDISQYLRNELIRKYSGKYFHVIIGKNDDFSFSISENSHFAEIKQEQYRVLIFSTRKQKRIKVDLHNVNNQMKLRWQSVVIKRIDN